MTLVEARAGLQCSLITFSGAATAACAKRDDGPAKTHTLLSSHTASRQQRSRCDTGQCLQLLLDGSAKWSLWRAVVKPVQPQELLELLCSSRTDSVCVQGPEAFPNTIAQSFAALYTCLRLMVAAPNTDLTCTLLQAAECATPLLQNISAAVTAARKALLATPASVLQKKSVTPLPHDELQDPLWSCGLWTSWDMSCHRVPTRPSCSALLPRPPKPGATGASV